MRNEATSTRPRWHAPVLVVAGIQCLIWGIGMILVPEQAAKVYGLAEPPRELFLWQGVGLVIVLYGVGYALAAVNSRQHWGLVLIGLLAKVLGPIGMVFAVIQGTAPSRTLWLLPINDVIWWVPFALIVRDGFRNSQDYNQAFDESLKADE